jgi:CBS domain containing-hemolysin-like protein
VAAEFSLVGVRRSRVLALVEEGDRRAVTLLRVITSLDSYISATQLGITLASLALGWVGESTLAHLFTPLFARIVPDGYAVTAAHTAAVVLAFAIITFLHIVLGELAPKTLALERTERTALVVAWPMELFYKAFKAPIWVLNYSGSFVLRVCGMQSQAEHANTYTKEELRQLVEMSHKGGHLQNEEMVMVNNIIEFSEVEVREAMVPRTEIVAINDLTSLDEIYKVFTENKISRLPVYHESLDNIIGVLFLKDVVPYFSAPQGFSIPKVINRPIFVPETMPLQAALHQMKRSRMHIAIVVDEHGGTTGLVTLENLLEQIVGQIEDEFDVEGHDIISEKGRHLIKGTATIKTINRKLKLKLPEDESYTTLAGFMMDRAGKVLTVGQKVEYENLVFTVTQSERFRILEVEMVDKREGTPRVASA